jgi:putative transposase
MAYANGVTLEFSRPGKPAGASFVAPFNGKFRAGSIHQNWFLFLAAAQKKCEAIRPELNNEDP